MYLVKIEQVELLLKNFFIHWILTLLSRMFTQLILHAGDRSMPSYGIEGFGYIFGFFLLCMSPSFCIFSKFISKIFFHIVFRKKGNQKNVMFSLKLP